MTDAALKTLKLVRLSHTDYGTYGHLATAENERLAVTLELPWKNNERRVSCIPAGTYRFHRRFSPKHNCEVFEVLDVPGRDDIEIHVGNFAHDSLGCILVGTAFATINGEPGISGSTFAFHKFMDRMKGVDVGTFIVTDPE